MRATVREVDGEGPVWGCGSRTSRIAKAHTAELHSLGSRASYMVLCGRRPLGEGCREFTMKIVMHESFRVSSGCGVPW